MENNVQENATLAAKYPGASFWAFGDGADMVDELGALAAGAIKTATCSALEAYQHDAASPRIVITA